MIYFLSFCLMTTLVVVWGLMIYAAIVDTMQLYQDGGEEPQDAPDERWCDLCRDYHAGDLDADD